MKTRILIAEPSQVIVEGLKAILGKPTRFSLLSPVPNLDDIESHITALKPDIVIANPTLAHDAGAMLQSQGVKTAALLYQYVEPWRLNTFDLVLDIRQSAGTIVEHLVQLAERNPEQDGPRKITNYDLTKRETAVLIEVARGLTNKEIAEKMNVSVHTVISHRKTSCTRPASSRWQASPSMPCSTISSRSDPLQAAIFLSHFVFFSHKSCTK